MRSVGMKFKINTLLILNEKVCCTNDYKVLYLCLKHWSEIKYYPARVLQFYDSSRTP